MFKEEIYSDSISYDGYSVNFLIKTIFEYEIRNNLIFKESDDNETKVVIAYFEKRIEEIKEKYL